MEATKYRRALVSGGLGFIGSSISERLLSLGLDVTIVDSCISNVVSASDLTFERGALQVVDTDISRYLHGPGRGERFDLIVHAASYVGSLGVLGHIGHLAADMIASTAAVLQHCLHTNAHLIFLSSSEIYGRNGVLDERMEVRVPAYFNPRIEYALAKLTGEAMIHNAGHLGLRAICLRPFNVVGPRQSSSAGFVLPTFVRQALSNAPLTVFHPGSQERAFVSVDDVADLVVQLVTEEVIDTPQTMNVGCLRNAMTVFDLACRVREMVGCASSIQIVNPRDRHGELYADSESLQKLCDTARAEMTGWSARRDLNDIIQDCIDYYRRRLSDSRYRCA